MADEPLPGIDSLWDAILQDELEDMHATQTKMSIPEYAKYQHCQPQLIYYYIRTGKLSEERCICGRKVLDVAEADKFFAERDAKKRSNT